MPTPDGQTGDELAPGTTLGRYEIRRQLGRGGMGAVYEAVHRDLKKRVAVKVLMASLAANDEAKQRFLREGEAASRIRHPHVVDVTDVGTDGALSYLVMEYLEGEDLASRLLRDGALPVQEAADILLPVAAGVGAAHDEGVIHRDLKPENIFLARSRHGGAQPMVLDFGVSKVLGDRSTMALTGTAATFGTPFYMPPEQLRGARQADQRSDQYALGVVLYECVTGQRPFGADNIYAMLRAIGDGEYPRPRTVRPQLPEAVEAVIVRAMQLEPAARFPSMRHFGAALLPFASETARVVWADTFRIRDDPQPGAPSAGFTRAMPPQAGGSVSGTRIMPSTGTTLGAAIGQRLALPEPPRARRGLVVGLALGGAGLIALVVALLRPAQVPAPAPAGRPPSTETAAAPASSYRIDVETEPPTATLELDGAPVGIGPLRRDLPRDGRLHRLVARASGYQDAVVRFADQPPPRLLTLDRTLVPPPPAANAAPLSPAPPRPHHPHKPAGHEPRAPAGPAPSNGAPVID